MLTTERQTTEGFKKPWYKGCKSTYCYVCKENFKEGDEIHVLLNAPPNARHHFCARKPVVEKGKHRPASGTGKRRRCGGHGWSGGDGFVDL